MAFNNYHPSKSSTPVVLNLIIINAVVFIAQLVLDKTNGQHEWLTNILALHGLKTGDFKPYQLITHMFAHGGIFHIFFNMYALWLFGSVLERNWGPKKFLFFYFACGLAAAFTQMFFVPYGAAIGASGAIMGLLAAFAYTYPNIQFYIIPIPVPIKAKWLAVIYACIDIFGGISGVGDVAHFAHLGGLVMGFIIVYIWKRPSSKNYF